MNTSSYNSKILRRVGSFSIEASSGPIKYSRPDMAPCLEDDLTMSEEGEFALVAHWSEVPLSNSSQSSVVTQRGLQMDAMSATTKQPVDASSDSFDCANVDCLPLLVKSATSSSVVLNVHLWTC